MMKKIRMTVWVLMFAMTVCIVSGCSSRNGNNMADEATAASQGMPDDRNGNNQNGTAGETGTGSLETGNSVEDGGAGNGTAGSGGTTGTGDGSALEDRTGGPESTGAADGLVNDVERMVP